MILKDMNSVFNGMTMILDQHTIRITGEQAGAKDKDKEKDNNGNRESRITITTRLG